MALLTCRVIININIDPTKSFTDYMQLDKVRTSSSEITLMYFDGADIMEPRTGFYHVPPGGVTVNIAHHQVCRLIYGLVIQ